MNRYNIKVLIPILNKRYELFIPNNILIGNILYMLVNSIKDMNGINLEKARLYDSSNGEMLDLDSYVYKYINNGSELILI